MDIQSVDTFGVEIKSKEGKISINSEKKKEVDAALFSFPLEVKGWGSSDSESVLINGAGEYEVKGVHVVGYPIQSTVSKKKIYSASYFVLGDGVRVLYLAPASGKKEVSDSLSKLNEVDVVVAPVGDGLPDGTLTPQELVSLATGHGASILCVVGGDSKYEDKIGKEVSSSERANKISIKRKDINPGSFKAVFLGKV